MEWRKRNETIIIASSSYNYEKNYKYYKGFTARSGISNLEMK